MSLGTKAVVALIHLATALVLTSLGRYPISASFLFGLAMARVTDLAFDLHAASKAPPTTQPTIITITRE